MPVRVQTEDFDVSRELALLRGDDRAVGAVAAFIGTVRDVNDDARVASMTLEHYPGMTEKALGAIVEAAKSRWDVIDALVIHRVGTLAPSDQIVLVGVTGAHRGEAFAACEFIMDYLRGRALGRGTGRGRRRGGALAGASGAGRVNGLTRLRASSTVGRRD